MLYKAHKFFAFVSFFTIVIFFTSTLIVELFFTYKEIECIKALIVFPGLSILVPSIAITAISGHVLAKKSQKLDLITIKKKRMPIIAFNGIVILIPSAIYLNHLASINVFDTSFYVVQALELVAGGVNIFLMCCNIRDSRNY